MSAEKDFSVDAPDDSKLVRPKVEFQSLLQHAGATKDIFTMKEVMFYLGQYIMKKQLFDKKQQHIVHCAQDALGRVLGVESFSVKEPRALFAMLTKNLIAVKSQESLSSDEQSSSQLIRTAEVETESCTSSLDRNRRRRRRRRRSRMSSEPGPSQSTETVDVEDESEEEEEEEEGRKRRRSDSYSLTFDQSLSWCVIGGLGGGRDRHSSHSSESHSTSERSEVTIPPSDSESDNFSVEFEVESIDSEDYDEDDASLSGDDQVYEVTIIEAEDEDSFDEDTEISEADYWKCGKCEELNPPLPRHCQRCWTLRQHWLPEVTVNKSDAGPKPLPPKPKETAAKDSPGSDVEENEGVDVPDGKRAKTPSQSQDDSTASAPNSQDLSSSLPSSSSLSSQEKLWTDSQPSSSDSQETLPCSPTVPPAAAPAFPELERNVSAELRLPDSCLDPCVICQSRPKNGCIVHGRTGHLMSCYVCARKLKKRNKLCPVCRMPIQSVILTYLS
uniref:MDM2 proto-oncogene n=1 Tax=Neogobius melanostomus TaxID=47308 RepID=A0A8C6WQT1_9GOBI